MDYDFIDEKPQSSIDNLSIDPFLASAWNGENYGVIKKFRINQRVKCYCVICTSQHWNHTEESAKMAQKISLQKKYVCTESNNKETEITSISFNKFLILYLGTFAYSIILMRQVQKCFLQIRFLHMISSKPAPMEMLIVVRILFQLVG